MKRSGRTLKQRLYGLKHLPTHLRRARFFRGHGVHSPYVYDIVRKVFMQRELVSKRHAGKRPRAGGAERGRAHAPPLSLRGRSEGGFCFFMPVICLLLMLFLLLLLLLLLFFFFLLL